MSNNISSNTSSKISDVSLTEYFKLVINVEIFCFPNEDILYFNEKIITFEAKVLFKKLDIPISVDKLKKTVKQ